MGKKKNYLCLKMYLQNYEMKNKNVKICLCNDLWSSLLILQCNEKFNDSEFILVKILLVQLCEYFYF